MSETLFKDDITKLQREEIDATRRSAEIEMHWWKNNILATEEDGITTGKLVLVPGEGDGYRLIGRLRNGNESRALAPKALSLLRRIVTNWKLGISTLDMDDQIFLSISSLYRSFESQKKLIDSGENAALVSSHQAGMAIDFDPRGYYLGADRKPINDLSEKFDQRIIQVLEATIESCKSLGLCNFIRENKFKNNGVTGTIKYASCYHVCVSPIVYHE